MVRVKRVKVAEFMPEKKRRRRRRRVEHLSGNLGVGNIFLHGRDLREDWGISNWGSLVPNTAPLRGLWGPKVTSLEGVT